MSVVQRLVQCIENEEVAQIPALLKKNPDVKATVDSYKTRDGSPPLKGISPLHIAARKGMQEVIDMLMDNGYDLNIKNKHDGNTSLHYAGLGGHVHILKTLIFCGVDVSVTNKNGDTPLHSLARCMPGERNIAESMKEIVDLGISINNQNKDGDTPFHLAVQTQHLMTIEAMMFLRCDITVRNKDGETALHKAVQTRRLDYIDYLLILGMESEAKTKAGHTPLHVACRHGNEEAVESLLMLVIPAKDGKELKQLLTIAKTDRIKHLLKVADRFKDFMAFRQYIAATRKTYHSTAVFSSAYPQENLGLIMESITYPNTSTYSVYTRREEEGDTWVKLKLNDDEELASDIFIVKVNQITEPCQIVFKVVLNRLPEPGEELLAIFENGMTIPVQLIPQAGQFCFCMVTINVKEDDSSLGFAVMIRKQRQLFKVGPEGSTIQSKADDKFALEIPKDTFTKQITLDLQVYKSTDLQDQRIQATPGAPAGDLTSLTDIYQITVSQQPKKEILMKLPLQVKPAKADDTVIITADENEMEDEDDLDILDCKPTISGPCLVFPISHFSIHVAVSRLRLERNRRQVYEEIEKKVGKTCKAVFYVLTKTLRSGLFLSVVECCPIHKGRDKRYRYKELGYETQDPIESDPIKITAGHKFAVEFSGGIVLADPDSNTTIKVSSRNTCKQAFTLQVPTWKGKSIEGGVRVTRVTSGKKAKWSKNMSVRLAIRLQKPADFWSEVYDAPVGGR